MALIVLTIYLVFIVLRYGWLPSVSDSYYHISHRVLFFLAMAFVAFITLSAQEWHYLYFPLASFGIMLVGVAPNFKTKGLAKGVHFLGAGLAGVCGVLGMGFEFDYWWSAGITAVSVVLTFVFLKRNALFWAELVLFYTILITIYL